MLHRRRGASGHHARRSIPVDFEVVGRFMGKELVGMKYVSPLTGEDCPIVTADYVTADSGTCNLFCVFRFT